MALLAGTELPPDDAVKLEPVADVLAALRARPASDEMAGEVVAMAEFRHQFGDSAHAPNRARRRRPRSRSSLVSAKAAAAAAITVVALGAATVAAVDGDLPEPLQQFAHRTIGAPAARHGAPTAGDGQPTGAQPAGTGTPFRQNAPGSAAFRLCKAYEYASVRGTAAQKAAAFRKLAKAAGGAGKIAAFCGAGPHPSATQSEDGNPGSGD